MALINQPQRASVIWAFSSVLYYGKWTKAVDSVREKSQMLHGFTPEILRDSQTTSNQSLDEDVSHFVCLVNDSVNMLAGRQPFSECLLKYLSSACSPPLVRWIKKKNYRKTLFIFAKDHSKSEVAIPVVVFYYVELY